MAAAAAFAILEKKEMKPTKVVSLDTFFSKYIKAEDGFKYEYNNGIIEKTPRMITKKQWFIVDNLESRFVSTVAYQRGDRLFREPEMWTSETQVRVPDLAFLTKKQIRNESPNDKTISQFVIEVISKTDMMYKVYAKLHEYYKSGVAVVWLVLPESEEVYVYTATNQVEICTGDVKCFAGTALLDFEITVADIFRK